MRRFLLSFFLLWGPSHVSFLPCHEPHDVQAKRRATACHFCVVCVIVCINSLLSFFFFLFSRCYLSVCCLTLVPLQTSKFPLPPRPNHPSFDKQASPFYGLELVAAGLFLLSPHNLLLGLAGRRLLRPVVDQVEGKKKVRQTTTTTTTTRVPSHPSHLTETSHSPTHFLASSSSRFTAAASSSFLRFSSARISAIRSPMSSSSSTTAASSAAPGASTVPRPVGGYLSCVCMCAMSAFFLSTPFRSVRPRPN